jgi:hypothetical protein
MLAVKATMINTFCNHRDDVRTPVSALIGCTGGNILPGASPGSRYEDSRFRVTDFVRTSEGSAQAARSIKIMRTAVFKEARRCNTFTRVVDWPVVSC